MISVLVPPRVPSALHTAFKPAKAHSVSEKEQKIKVHQMSIIYRPTGTIPKKLFQHNLLQPVTPT